MRVLFVANDPPGHAVYRYRCGHIADELRRQGHTATIAYVGDARVRVDHDIVILHRICANAQGRAFARAARACGAALIYSTDDLIFDEKLLRSDAAMPPRYAAFAPLHRAMLQEADAALVSTEYLAQRTRTDIPGAPVFLIRNFLSPEMLAAAERARSHPPDDPVVLGYLSGSATHDGDLNAIAEPLAEALSQNPETRLLLVGPVTIPSLLTPFERPERGQLVRSPFVGYQKLPDLLAGVNVNLAPLDARRLFNLAKSEIKLLEAAAVSVPTIVTDAAGFAEARERLPARYVRDASDWRDALTELIADPASRLALGKAARASLTHFGTASANAAIITEVFDALIALPRSPRSSARSHIVNWPFSVKHLVKDTVRFLQRR